MSEVTYPLFLRDDYDGNMCFVESKDDLNYKLEENDVDEFSGWDLSGRPVSLEYRNKVIEAMISADRDESDNLLDAIRGYAIKHGNVTDPLLCLTSTDPMALFEWADKKAEENWKSRTIRSRMSRFFRRFSRK